MSTSPSSGGGTPRRLKPAAFFCTIMDANDMKSLNIGNNISPSSPIREDKLEPVVDRLGKLEARPWNRPESSQTRLLIKGGRIVNDDSMFDGDIYIEDGVIKQVGTNLIIPGGTRTLEAKGKLVLPGGIDADVHLQLPFMGVQSSDDFYHGTKAALAGGTTMIVDCVLEKGPSLLDSYEKWRSWADEKACCDYGLGVAITSWSEQVHDEMELLSREKGVNAFAAFMAYKGSLMLNDEQLINLFRACKDLGAIVQVHAENGDIIYENEQRLLAMGLTGPESILYSRPEEVEAEATNRAVVLSNQCNCPVYIQRISSKSAADVLAAKRKEGCVAYGETLAACIGTDGSHYFNKCWRHAAGHVTTPPLRADPATPGYLLDMLGSDNLQVLASNNLTFSGSQKALGVADFTRIPHGLNGLEDRMSILWEKGVMTGKLDPCHFVAVTSTNAAKIFNIYPRKGRIQVGSDADVVVWDPTVRRVISAKTHHQAVDFNVFEGMECHGVPLYVISQGRLVVEEGQLHVSQGSGRFVPMPAFSPFVYARIQERDQCILQKVARDAYEGASEGIPNGVDGPRRPVLGLESPITPGKGQEFHTRPPTRSGGRNLQDSTFSLSGAQIDDEKSPRSGIRVHNPPGGRSTGLW